MCKKTCWKLLMFANWNTIQYIYEHNYIHTYAFMYIWTISYVIHSCNASYSLDSCWQCERQSVSLLQQNNCTWQSILSSTLTYNASNTYRKLYCSKALGRLKQYFKTLNRSNLVPVKCGANCDAIYAVK